jgi:multiple sugar transport system permease protein
MGRSKAHYWFVGPAILLMLLLLIAPVVVAAALSMTDYSLGNSGFNWIGWENYEKLFTRRSYSKMFTASLTYVLLVVPISVALGLGSAIFFLPVMATLLAMAIVWEFALNPIVGVVNDILRSGCDKSVIYGFLSGSWLGYDPLESWYGSACEKKFPLWLGDRKYALGTIAFIGIWQAFGFNMVLYLAGLTSVPRELYQAAQMDGADSAWERFKLVTWPMLGPTHVFVITISSIRSFQVFDTVEALTEGGPSKSTYVMIYAMFEKGVRQNLLGMGSAITIVFLIFVLILTLVQVYFVNRKVHY